MRRMFKFAVVLFCFLSFASPALTSGKSANTIDYKQAVSLLLEYDRLWDAIPQEQKDKQTITTDEDLAAWTAEIVPYFAYEKVVDPSIESSVGRLSAKEPGGMVFPTSIEFQYYGQDALYNFHVLGLADCLASAITINARFANTESPWYGRSDVLSTVIHELAHVQGICVDGTEFDSEASAQIVTLEILAAMANRGTDEALVALMYDLRAMSIQTARWAALEEDKYDEFTAVLDTVLDTATEKAGEYKSINFWRRNDNKDMFVRVLYSYNYAPIAAVHDAFNNNNQLYGAYIPINYWDQYLYNMYTNSSDFSYGQEVEPPSFTEQMINSYNFYSSLQFEPLLVDDLHYFVTHAEEMIDEMS